MSVQALHTAATGMKAMDTKLDVIANNLANIGTTAFKRSRANFEDILYQVIALPGQQNGLGEFGSLGKQVGIGAQLSSTQQEFTQGAVDQTDQPYDLLIQGDGFFQVQAFIDGVEQTVYSRAGNFTLDANGQLVLGNHLGARLEPAITIPQDAVDVQISREGLVSARVSGATEFQDVGQIELARFINNAGLEQLGNNLFQETDGSGPAILSDPGQDGLGILLQGSLELSNVDPVRELVELIRTQRSFEMNSQSIQTADKTLDTLNQLALRR